MVLRALRMTVFAAVCVALATTGHWLESGRRPGAAALVLGAGVGLFVANRLAGRERSFAAIGSGVVAIQALLHVVFVLCDTGHRAATEAGMAMHGAHLAPEAAGTVSAFSAVAPADPRLGMSAGMALAHLIAAIAAAAWLRCGEAALWSLCRWLSARAVAQLRALLALLAGGAHTAGPRLLSLAPLGGGQPCRTRLLRHAVIRRGPPCMAVSA
jgi:hypothetical protein